MDFGWKKKAARLRMTILVGAHPLAKELAPEIVRLLDVFRVAAKSESADAVQGWLIEPPTIEQDALPIWEPAQIYGWEFHATLYRQQHQLWWLVRANRLKEDPPSDKDVGFLTKVLEHLGADPRRDAVIAPWSSPAGEPPLPFGWWTWINQQPLYEMRVKGTGRRAIMRVFPLNAPETDGYVRLDIKP